MQAGRLRHEISIQSKVRTVDAGGGYTEVWSTVTNGTRPASVTSVAGLEQYRADQLQEIVTHRIWIRYLEGVVTGMRVLFGTRIFDIKNVVDPEERNVMLGLLCEERKAV